MISFKYNKTENELICIPQGRMSAENTTAIDDSIREKTAEVTSGSGNTGKLKIVFDLAGVDYIASSFIRICVATAKLPETGDFRIINTSPLIKKTFKIAGLDEILKVS